MANYKEIDKAKFSDRKERERKLGSFQFFFGLWGRS